MDSSVPKKNRIKIGCRVFGKFGPLIPNPNSKPGKKSRRVRSEASGTVVSANAYKYWNVLSDVDGAVHKVSCGCIRIVDSRVGVPLDENNTNDVSNLYLSIY